MLVTIFLADPDILYKWIEMGQGNFIFIILPSNVGLLEDKI